MGPTMSLRRLSELSGLSVQTVVRVVFGDGTSPESILAVAKALKVDPGRIRAIRSEPAHQPFHLPDEADQLDPYQRDAVLRVIRGMLRRPETGEASQEQGKVLRSVKPAQMAARELKSEGRRRRAAQDAEGERTDQ